MKNTNKALTVFLLINFLATSAYAKSYSIFNPVPEFEMRPMTLERPSKNFSSYIVDIGHIQIETTLYSVTLDKNSQTKINQKSVLDSTTVRLGITSDSEVSIVISSLIWQKTTNRNNAEIDKIRANDDVVLRYKKNIFGGDSTKNGGSLALMPVIKVPSGSKNYSNNHYEGGLRTHYDYKMDSYLLSYLFDIEAVRNTKNSSYTTLIGNVFDLGKNLTPKLYTYIEIASFKTTQKKTGAKNYFDFGSVYQVSKNFSIDAVFNFGVSKAADDFSFITGCAYRF